MMMLVFLLALIVAVVSGFQVPSMRTGTRSCLSMAGDHIITIGTRGSPLALAQAYLTKQLLEDKYPELKKKEVWKSPRL